MAITNGYATLAQFQAYANMSTITADETTTIEKAIEAASRTIDRIADRRFYMDANATARLYRTVDFYTLPVDDIGSTSGLVVAFDATGNGNYTNTLTLNTDYVLDPVTAPQKGRPYTAITMVGATVFPLPISRRPQVQVTAKFGWYNGTPPDDVVEACLILSADYVKRASSVGGVLGLSELGAIRMSPLGRDISAIVRAYRREVVA
ncbi:MAG: hypothetical protein EBR06_03355 [Acidimicrobiia bacterium]|nr:hypothetical protein [Acidimicrobiia bacterium]